MRYEVGDRLITPDNQQFQIKKIRPDGVIVMDEFNELIEVGIDLLYGYQGSPPRAVSNFRKL